MRVLVTGGAGMLGGHVVRAATESGHAVRVMVRQRRAPLGETGDRLTRADLASGEGLQSAVDDVDAIIHTGSDPRNAEAVDVRGTLRLIEAARSAGVAHLVYISIVGVDQIPYTYYRRKRQAEALIQSSGLPYSIVRATQFHSSISWVLWWLTRLPMIMAVPSGFAFQSVDVRDVAHRLVQSLTAEPSNRIVNFGGPEVLTANDMARAWLDAQHIRKAVIRVPLPGALAAAFRAGKNIAPSAERGGLRWQNWLALEFQSTSLPPH